MNVTSVFERNLEAYNNRFRYIVNKVDTLVENIQPVETTIPDS